MDDLKPHKPDRSSHQKLLPFARPETSSTRPSRRDWADHPPGSSTSLLGAIQIDHQGRVAALSQGLASLFDDSPEALLGQPANQLTRSWPETAQLRFQQVVSAPHATDQGAWDLGSRVILFEAVPLAHSADGSLPSLLLIIRERLPQHSSTVLMNADALSLSAETESRIRQLEHDARAMSHFQNTETATPLPPFRKTQPQPFCSALEQYAALLRDSIQEADYRLDFQVSDRVRSLASGLAAFAVGPRDIIEIHSTVLRQVMSPTRSSRDHAYLERGRLLLLELMGEMLAQYRKLIPNRSLSDLSAGSHSHAASAGPGLPT